MMKPRCGALEKGVVDIGFTEHEGTNKLERAGGRNVPAHGTCAEQMNYLMETLTLGKEARPNRFSMLSLDKRRSPKFVAFQLLGTCLRRLSKFKNPP